MTERVFTVAGSSATAATPITLADAGFRERHDLQEWVLAHPEIPPARHFNRNFRV